MNIQIFKSFGLSDKESLIYLALLRVGPSSVRKLAEQVGLNRGTAYDTLKGLEEKGLVSFFDKQGKQHFVAESPEKIFQLLKTKKDELISAEKLLEKSLPELEAIYNKGGERPVARYFEKEEIRTVLEDVLETCEKSIEPLYRIYSAEGVRHHLYESFPTFSDVRIGKGIQVKVIALGHGGELRGFDERKWLPVEPRGVDKKETYIIIYPGKTASISFNAQNDLIGVVIENEGIYQTQKQIFDSLWERI